MAGLDQEGRWVKNQGQPLSQDGWPFTSMSGSNLKEAGPSCVLWQKTRTKRRSLARRRGTRAPQWPASKILDGIRATPG